MERVQKLMDDHCQWADQTFGKDRTEVAALHHLTSEVFETIEAIELDFHPSEVEEEFADCFLLLIGAVKKYGMSFEGLVSAAEAKLEVCKKRDWGKPDERGVVNHIKK